MSNNGFTLMELLIAMVIIGVLSAIAYPNYTQWVSETRRTDAQRALTELAAREEKYFSQCNVYTTTIAGTGITDCTLAGGLGMSPLSPDGHYALSVTLPPAPSPCPATATIANCFVATADPDAATTSKKQMGTGKLQITPLGQKFWDKNHDGTVDYTTENTWRKN